jgi:hypothetical protein
MNILSSASFIDYGGSGLLAQTNPVEIINPIFRRLVKPINNIFGRENLKTEEY